MATLNAKVYAHHFRNDDTCNVKIRLFHRDQYKIIDTDHLVSLRQVEKHPKNSSEFILRDKFIISEVEKEIKGYKAIISKLGAKAELFTCEQLRDFLVQDGKEVDFIAFCNEYIDGLVSNKKKKSAANFRTVKNHLTDFFRRQSVNARDT